jgi:hypothetical protein
MCVERLRACIVRSWLWIWSLLAPEIPVNDDNDTNVRKEHVIYFYNGDTERVNIRFHTLRGMLDGPYIVYSRDGRAMSVASYCEDKLEGEVVDYDVYVRGSGGELERVKKCIRMFSGGREVLSME